MSQIIRLNRFPTTHEAAISWINQQLAAQGLLVKPSFDLQAAKSAHTDCTCPYHGTAQCDCQIVVLLIYDKSEGPVSLVVHSQDGHTYLSMIGEPDIIFNDMLSGKIFHALGHQSIQSP